MQNKVCFQVGLAWEPMFFSQGQLRVFQAKENQTDLSGF
jgi:hypothetical protein